MASRPPLLDSRSFDDLLARLRGSASRYIPDWKPGTDADPGVMLQHTFARLMEIAIERLNRVPEKLMLAFLEAMNISPLPPVPARAPLVFALKDDEADAKPVAVPKGTAVSAKTTGGQTLTFETTDDLVVIPTAITAAYTVEPGLGRYGDYTDKLSGEGFTPFIGDSNMPGAWFFVINKALDLEKLEKIELLVQFTDVVHADRIREVFLNPHSLTKKWSYSGAEGECEFSPSYDFAALVGEVYSFTISAKNDTGSAISLQYSDTLGGGYEPPAGYYIKAAAENSAILEDGAAGLSIAAAQLIMQSKKRPPTHLFNRSTRLDPEGFILPYGQKPRAGDTFDIGIGDLPGEGEQVAIIVSMIPNVYKGQGSEIGLVGKELYWNDMDWAYSTPYGWARVWPTKVEVAPASGQDGYYVYSMTFNLDIPGEKKIGGEEGYWLRATLPRDDCGVEAQYVESGGSYSHVPGTGIFTYPVIRSLSIEIQHTVRCRVYRQAGYLYMQYSVWNESTPVAEEYQLLDDDAFYLGFDRWIPQQPVSLYIDVAPIVQYSWSLSDVPPAWECLTAQGWEKVYTVDETDGFDRSGMVRFLAPDALLAKLFNHTEQYWVRVRGVGGVRLNGIYLNAIPAEQAVSVPREAVGISNGMPDQRFSLRGAPILVGQQLWVREDEAPTAAERSDTTVEVRRNPVTLAQENWVLWHEQNSFSISTTRSRHYLLDRDSGEIRFGDGVRGMIPWDGSPIAASYRYGGGVAGNVAAGAISKLSTKINGVDTVDNPIPASGGADSEGTAEVMDRGPMAIRHRGRGVTAQDIEWLVREAAGASVDRIKCLPGEDGQPFTLMLLPAEDGLRPLPDGELSHGVRAYLDRCLPASLPGRTFGIIGPKYITTDLTVAIVPVNHFEGSIIRERAMESLRTFLHPRKGGIEGKGWEFSRNVYLSEVCALLESVEGVEYALASTVTIRPAAVQREITLQTNDIRFLASYPAGSFVMRKPYEGGYGGGGLIEEQWLLAEPDVADVLPRTIRVTGFREGDELTATASYSYDGNINGFYVNSSHEFPPGSMVRFSDGFTARLGVRIHHDTQLLPGMLTEDSDERRFSDRQGGFQERLAASFTYGVWATVYHSDTLTVTHVWDTEFGGYAVRARRPSESAQVHEGMVLECLSRGVKSRIAAPNENTSVAEYDGDTVTILFNGLYDEHLANQDTGMYGGPSPVEVILGRQGSVEGGLCFLISAAKPITDTAYLLDRELCTPGVIDVQIAEAEEKDT
ncbi:MAG: putative baseplate assembly protein [Clostridiales bacterium]|nr:putative baseplate assembly protein [Clostridiales bacterium]